MSKLISLPPDVLENLKAHESIVASRPFCGGLLPSPQTELARLQRRIKELEERILELERKP